MKWNQTPSRISRYSRYMEVEMILEVNRAQNPEPNPEVNRAQNLEPNPEANRAQNLEPNPEVNRAQNLEPNPEVIRVLTPQALRRMRAFLCRKETFQIVRNMR